MGGLSNNSKLKGRGSGIAVPNDQVFTAGTRAAAELARDSFFSVNPARLLPNVQSLLRVGSNIVMTQWDGTQWRDMTFVIQGPAGKDGVGGGAGGDPDRMLPPGYTYAKSAQNKLQLLASGTVIAEQDEFGSWFKTSIGTGTGSLHIGDIHSNGSCGENVGWVNTDSNICYYPAWGGVKVDGSSSISVSAREHGPKQITEPNGALSVDTAGVDYNFVINPTQDVAFFAIEVVPAESYTGKLTWIAVKSTGKTVAEFTQDVTAVSGTPLTVQFKYPLWVKSGQQFTVSLKKADGSFLQSRKGTTDATRPYRRTSLATFIDHDVLHVGNAIKAARALETLTGANRLDASAIKNLDTGGGYVGTINFAAGLAQFANATKQSYWKAATAGTLGGVTFAVGDQLVCKANVTGTPANLTDAAYWAVNPNTNAIATASLAGMVKPTDGLTVAGDGALAVKLGTGMKFDASKNVVPDETNIDVTKLKNADSLVLGVYKDALNASSTLATLANAQKGNWWNVAAPVTISGTAFAPGDQLWCKTAVAGTPTDLTNFNRVPASMAVATAAVAGIVKLSSAAPSANAATASVGTSTDVARGDHVHPKDAPVDNLNSDSATDALSAKQGKALKAAIDAKAAVAASGTPAALGASASLGTSADAARADHVHALPGVAVAPVTETVTVAVASLTNATIINVTTAPTAAAVGKPIEGTGIDAGTTVQSISGNNVTLTKPTVGPSPVNTVLTITTTPASNGLMSSSDKAKLNAIATGAAALEPTNAPQPLGNAASLGTAKTAAASDHVHPLPANAAAAQTFTFSIVAAYNASTVDIGTTDSPPETPKVGWPVSGPGLPAGTTIAGFTDGTTKMYKLSNGLQAYQTAGQVYTVTRVPASAGLLSAADKVKLDGIVAAVPPTWVDFSVSSLTAVNATSLVFSASPSPIPVTGAPVAGVGIQPGTVITEYNGQTRVAKLSLATNREIKNTDILSYQSSPGNSGIITANEKGYLNGSQAAMNRGKWWCRNYIGDRGPTDYEVDWILATATTGPIELEMIPTIYNPALVAFTLGRILQKLSALLWTDNDWVADGPLCATSQLLASKDYCSNPWPAQKSKTDVDQATNSANNLTTPSNMYKVVLGKDATQFYFVNVAPSSEVVNGSSATNLNAFRYEFTDNFFGLAAELGYPGPGGTPPLIRTAPRFISENITPDRINGGINTEFPMLALLPVRIAL